MNKKRFIKQLLASTTVLTTLTNVGLSAAISVQAEVQQGTIKDENGEKNIDYIADSQNWYDVSALKPTDGTTDPVYEAFASMDTKIQLKWIDHFLGNLTYAGYTFSYAKDQLNRNSKGIVLEDIKELTRDEFNQWATKCWSFLQANKHKQEVVPSLIQAVQDGGERWTQTVQVFRLMVEYMARIIQKKATLQQSAQAIKKTSVDLLQAHEQLKQALASAGDLPGLEQAKQLEERITLEQSSYQYFSATEEEKIIRKWKKSPNSLVQMVALAGQQLTDCQTMIQSIQEIVNGQLAQEKQQLQTNFQQLKQKEETVNQLLKEAEQAIPSFFLVDSKEVIDLQKSLNDGLSHLKQFQDDFADFSKKLDGIIGGNDRNEILSRNQWGEAWNNYLESFLVEIQPKIKCYQSKKHVLEQEHSRELSAKKSELTNQVNQQETKIQQESQSFQQQIAQLENSNPKGGFSQEFQNAKQELNTFVQKSNVRKQGLQKQIEEINSAQSIQDCQSMLKNYQNSWTTLMNNVQKQVDIAKQQVNVLQGLHQIGVGLIQKKKEAEQLLAQMKKVAEDVQAISKNKKQPIVVPEKEIDKLIQQLSSTSSLCNNATVAKPISELTSLSQTASALLNSVSRNMQSWQAQLKSFQEIFSKKEKRKAERIQEFQQMIKVVKENVVELQALDSGMNADQKNYFSPLLANAAEKGLSSDYVPSVFDQYYMGWVRPSYKWLKKENGKELLSPTTRWILQSKESCAQVRNVMSEFLSVEKALSKKVNELKGAHSSINIAEAERLVMDVKLYADYLKNPQISDQEKVNWVAENFAFFQEQAQKLKEELQKLEQPSTASWTVRKEAKALDFNQFQLQSIGWQLKLNETYYECPAIYQVTKKNWNIKYLNDINFYQSEKQYPGQGDQEVYRKFRVANEYIANRLYQKMGVAVPQMNVVYDSQNVYLAYEQVSGQKKSAEEMSSLMGLKENVAIDLLLGNYDFIGMQQGFFNIQAKDGEAYRVNQGAALFCKAQGNWKNVDGDGIGSHFTVDGKIDDLNFLMGENYNRDGRTKNTNFVPAFKAALSGITKMQFDEGMNKIGALTEQQIREIVETYGMIEGQELMEKTLRDQLIQTLIRRKNTLLDKRDEFFNKINQFVNPQSVSSSKPNYDLNLNPIARGQYGEVYQTKDGKHVAKFLFQDKVTKGVENDYTELQILLGEGPEHFRGVARPFALVDLVNPATNRSAKADLSKARSGSLRSLWEANQPVFEKEEYFYHGSVTLINSLARIYERGILQGDFHSGNIFYKRKKNMKMVAGDFGLARRGNFKSLWDYQLEASKCAAELLISYLPMDLKKRREIEMVAVRGRHVSLVLDALYEHRIRLIRSSHNSEFLDEFLSILEELLIDGDLFYCKKQLSILFEKYPGMLEQIEPKSSGKHRSVNDELSRHWLNETLESQLGIEDLHKELDQVKQNDTKSKRFEQIKQVEMKRKELASLCQRYRSEYAAYYNILADEVWGEEGKKLDPEVTKDRQKYYQELINHRNSTFNTFCKEGNMMLAEKKELSVIERHIQRAKDLIDEIPGLKRRFEELKNPSPVAAKKEVKVDFDKIYQELLNAPLDQKQITQEMFKNICEMGVQDLQKKHSSLLAEVDSKANGYEEVIVVGDTHGKADLIARLANYLEFHPKAAVIFMGDYVDLKIEDETLRNSLSSINTLSLVLLLHHRFGNRVFCLRGNHEDISTNICGKNIMNSRTQRGIADEFVERRFESFDIRKDPNYDCADAINNQPESVKLLQKLYSSFPVAMRLKEFDGKNSFLAHGGVTGQIIKPGGLQEIVNLQRVDNLDFEDNPLLEQLLWNQPLPLSLEKNLKDRTIIERSEFSRNPGFQIAAYTKRAVQEFCKNNGFSRVIHAHSHTNENDTAVDGGFSCETAVIAEPRNSRDQSKFIVMRPAGRGGIAIKDLV